MKQPRFPFVLVGLTGLFVWLAVSDSGMSTLGAGFGALLTGAAALYQSRPVRDPLEEEPEPEEWEQGS
jgi:hypothetical protein